MNSSRILTSASGREGASQPNVAPRRQFLKAAAVLPFAWTAAAADAPTKPPLVDTHRIHAYAPDRLPPFDSPEMRRLWKTASDHGVAMQLHFEPRHAAGFEPLIREFPGTLVIIDHLGRPFQGTPDEHRRVVQWGRLKNTVIKLSAIPAPESYPHRDIRPVILELADAYGPDRMIYGGGFSAQATPQSYRAAFERARVYLSHWPDSDQDKVFGRNAVRLFRFRG